MLCDICWPMLRGQHRRQWNGTFDLHFGHHDSQKTFTDSIALGCGICRVLSEDLSLGLETTSDKPQVFRRSSASLSVVHDIEYDGSAHDIYRLDFKVELVEFDGVKKNLKKTFVLKQIGETRAPFRTPISEDTSSDEVFELAQHWISECKCVEKKQAWWPTRLIDLSALNSESYLDKKRDIYTVKGGIDKLEATKVKLEETKIRLIETKEAEMRTTKNNRYVTLSHCWGGREADLIKLYDSEQEKFKIGVEEFKIGLELRRLPKTFREAIEFAAKLENVGYIWIDALCIVQDSTEDWLKESALMDSVYSKSYLNISATAAQDSSVGLHSKRKPQLLWEDEINLNIDGIPGSKVGQKNATRPAKQEMTKSVKQSPVTWPFPFEWSWNLFGRRTRPIPTPKNTAGRIGLEVSEKKIPVFKAKTEETIRRCTLVNVSLWDTLVNQAPVNKRSWVLQERLIAPRVLHFCRGQIAWECAGTGSCPGYDRAEERPPGMPNFQLRGDEIQAEIRIKGLDPAKDGRRLRQARLRGAEEPDRLLGNLKGTREREIWALEIWARIVEVYSKTELTFANDKLIALSGIAKAVSPLMGAPYVAGLWGKRLESQLLWRIEPVFVHSDRRFEHPSVRPREYRAPSFSWASVDAVHHQKGNGIVYGEVTDRDLCIELDKGNNSVHVEVNPENSFGLVTGGHIMLWGSLRRAKLYRRERGRHYWHLKERNMIHPDLEAEEHTNVYLDSSEDDDKDYNIFNSDDIFVVPASMGPRIEDDKSKYLICLMLQQVRDHGQFRGNGTFRRIGLTKLSPWADKLARQHIITFSGSDIDLPHVGGHDGFDEKNGRHLIRII